MRDATYEEGVQRIRQACRRQGVAFTAALLLHTTLRLRVGHNMDTVEARVDIHDHVTGDVERIVGMEAVAADVDRLVRTVLAVADIRIGEGYVTRTELLEGMREAAKIALADMGHEVRIVAPPPEIVH